jgi:hypothetical protein
MILADDVLRYAGVIVSALAFGYAAFHYGYLRGRSSAFRDAEALLTAAPNTAVRVEDPYSIPLGFLKRISPHGR